MATFTKTVDPNGGADYLSIALWEAAEQGLYTSGDIAIADCKRTGPTTDTTAVNVAGWVSGTLPKVIVNSAHRHEGKWADTRVSDGNYIYLLDTTATTTNTITCTTTDAEFDGLLVHGKSDSITLLHANNGSTWTNLICRGKRLMRVSGNGITVNMYNTISYDTLDLSYLHVSSVTASVSNVFNCTFYGATASAARIFNDAGTINVKNTYASSFDSQGGSWGTSDYNVTLDVTAQGTTVATNQTSTATYFVDHANGDFHLNDTSQNLWGIASEDLSATFTTDIDGDTRPSSSAFGLGADYYVDAGGGVAVLPTLVSETLSVLSPSIQAGAVTISPALAALPLTVNPIAISTGLTTISPALLSLTAAVNNLSVQPGAVTISPDLTSLSLLVTNPSLSSIALLSPALTSLTVSAPDIAMSLLSTINPNLLSLVSSVNNPEIPYEQFVRPVLTSLTLSIYLPALLTGDIISAALAQLSLLVSNPSIQSGSVVISPSLASLTVEAMNPNLFDPALNNKYFYFNQSAIEFFKQQTGLDSNQFNELAKAYYRQVTSEDDEAFNELEAKAQKVAGFKGLSPTDWRNF